MASSRTFRIILAISDLTTGFIKNPLIPIDLAESSLSFSLKPVQMVSGYGLRQYVNRGVRDEKLSFGPRLEIVGPTKRGA